MTRGLCALLTVVLVAGATAGSSIAARGPAPQTAGVAAEPIAIEKTGSGPPLVFLGGLGCPPEVWDAVVKEVSKRHVCAVVSVAGFAGRPPMRDPNLAAVEAALARMVTTGGMRDAVLIGHSVGGSLALAVAAAHPGVFSRVVIVDAYPFPLGTVQPGVSPSQAASQAAALKALTLGQTNDEFIAQQSAIASMSVSNPDQAARIVRWMQASDRATIAEMQAEAVGRDLRPEASKIRVPVLVLGTWRGREPLGFSREKVLREIEEQYASVPVHTIAVSDTARHFVMLDDPAWLVAQIRAFLGE